MAKKNELKIMQQAATMPTNEELQTQTPPTTMDGLHNGRMRRTIVVPYEQLIIIDYIANKDGRYVRDIYTEIIADYIDKYEAANGKLTIPDEYVAEWKKQHKFNQ